MSDTDDQKAHDVFLKIVDRFDKRSMELDTRLFQVSTGALALSVTFRSSIVPADASCIWLLGAAWILFTLSIILFLVVSVLSVGMLHEIISDPSDADTTMEAVNPWIMKGSFALWIVFILGIVSFTLFGLLNL